MPVPAEQLRQVMRRWASTVTVVTMRADDQIHGLTATAFTSVSMNPPLVLVCIQNDSRSEALLRKGRCFAVNFLTEDQVALSERFAGRIPAQDRFEGLAYRAAVTGAPILENALAYLDCTVAGAYWGGDHTIYLGLVEDAGILREGVPLLYFQGTYRRLAPGNGGGPS
ncbi:flavin reductase family protein [Thermoflexus sp.]|uniref:flavin reductase family protein n=1 Tax=Thermoflexus sp. TaxID=1969742 RepID=UPI0025D3D49D|nr:flavin reductase family protein [Thermoflexus sp.]MCS6965120.1 flavin reductase family protein [Thermoflexus sp.]MCX7689475.1 flavin reductase family protein [Thermoflexus sp.]MDW8184660.1 flavin reductase family protein [Anaerolineae bacterium]